MTVPGHGAPVRVVSWNVWWRFGGNWRERESAIVATLRGLRPDIVGLQEVWAVDGTSQADVLADRLGMYASFAAPSLPSPPRPPESPDQAAVQLGVAVLSRWPVLRIREHRLPSTSRAAPVALLATVGHPAGRLHVMSSCVDPERELAGQRLAQTRALAALLADPVLDGPLPVLDGPLPVLDGPLPVLLAADLNATPTAPGIQVLTEVMVDPWVAGCEGEGVTFSSENPFTPADEWQLDQRIDYVLARPGHPRHPVSVERAFVVNAPVGGVHPSDHYAVVADLRVAV